MLSIILFLRICLSGSFFSAICLDKKFEETLLSSTLIPVFGLFLLGMVTNLEIGIYIIFSIGLLLIFVSCICLVCRRKNSRIESLKNLLTPGFVVYCFLLLVVAIGLRGKLCTEWDEFSHWGDVVKGIQSI